MGDINITGKYRVNGVPITTGDVGQTPWHSNINADQHELQNLKRIRIVNSSDNYPIYFGTGSCARYIFYNHSGGGGGGGDDRSNFLRWIQSRENGGSGNACNIGFADNNGNERLFLRHDGISVADGGMYVHGDIDVSGNYRQNGVIREFPPAHTSSNNNQVLTIYNNKMEWRTPATGGESQTPWLHNIDAANHTLTNLASLNGHSIIFVPPYSSSNNNQVLTVVSGSLQWHTPTSSQWLNAAGGGIYYPNRVGVAITNPAFPLDVGGRIHMRHEGGDTTAGIWYDSPTNALVCFLGMVGANLRLYSSFSSTDVITFDLANQLVGINRSTMAYPLHVNGDCNLDTGFVYRVGGVPLRIPPPLTTNNYVLTIVNGQMEWRPIPEGSTGFNLKGFVDKHQDLPNSGNAIGDAYVTENSGELWVWDGDDWFNAGKFVPEIDIREHQTPWLTNIDGGGYSLSNVGIITANRYNSPLFTTPSTHNIIFYGTSNQATSSLGMQFYISQGVVSGFIQLHGYSSSYGAPVAGNLFITCQGGDLVLGAGGAAAGAARIVVKNTGNVGIGLGATAPVYRLDVNGDVNLSAGSVYRINGVPLSTGGTPAGSNTQIQWNNNGAFGANSGLIWNNSGTQLRITGQQGNSPGVSPPPVDDFPLRIDGPFWGLSGLTIRNGGGYLNLFVGGSMLSGAPDLQDVAMISGSGTYGNFTIHSPYDLWFASESGFLFLSGAGSSVMAGTEVMRIQKNGNVGLGKTSPIYKLDVNGDVNTTGVYRVNGVPLDFSGLLKSITVLVSSQDILNLATTPKIVIPAPPAGQAIIPLQITYEVHQGNPFTGNISLSPVYQISGNSPFQNTLSYTYLTTPGPGIAWSYSGILASPTIRPEQALVFAALPTTPYTGNGTTRFYMHILYRIVGYQP